MTIIVFTLYLANHYVKIQKKLDLTNFRVINYRYKKLRLFSKGGLMTVLRYSMVHIDSKTMKTGGKSG